MPRSITEDLQLIILHFKILQLVIKEVYTKIHNMTSIKYCLSTKIC